jgi:hypothetical protein
MAEEESTKGQLAESIDRALRDNERFTHYVFRNSRMVAGCAHNKTIFEPCEDCDTSDD